MTRHLRLQRLESRTVPALVAWTGAGADANWSNPDNWQGEAVPQSGDDLVFPVTGANRVNFNDLPADIEYQSLAFDDADYRLIGNPIRLVGGIVHTGTTAADVQIDLDIVLTGSQTLSLQGGGNLILGGQIDLNGSALLVDAGAGRSASFTSLVGFGLLTKDGAGTLALDGPNSYAGPTIVSEGVLVVRSDGGLGSEEPFDGTEVRGGTLRFEGTVTSEEPIAFGDGGLEIGPGATTLNGPLTLDDGGGSITGDGSLAIGGSLTQAAGPLVDVLQLRGSDIRFTATSTVDVPSIDQGSGTTTFNGTVLSGTFGFAFGQANPGTLSGLGTLGDVTVSANGVLAPGADGVGQMTVDDLVVSQGRFVAGLAGVPGSVAVRGGVTLTGATFDVNVAGNFAVTLGAHYTVIDNDGSDAVNGTFDTFAEGAVVRQVDGVDLRITYAGGDGNDVELVADEADPPPPPAGDFSYAVAADAGGGPQVNVYARDGSLIRAFNAYELAFRGGVRVAAADFTGDGVPDVVTAPGVGGGPVIRVWDGETGAMVREFLAYDAGFRGGVFIAAGDATGDGIADIVTGAGTGGGPHVRVFADGLPTSTRDFFAYTPAFTGGVSVAVGDVTGDGLGDIVTGAASGGGPHVKAFDATTAEVDEVASFLAFETSFTGGVAVAVANGEIVATPGFGGGPVVRRFDAAGALQFEFLAYGAAFRGGIRVGVADIDGDGVEEILTGAGPTGGPHVRAFDATTGVSTQELFAFAPEFLGGVYIA